METRAQVRKEVSELSLLLEISRILSQSTDLRHEGSHILEVISKHTGMVRGMISLIDRRTHEVFIDAAHGLSTTQRQRGRYRFGEGVIGRVAQEGRPMVIPRISDEPLFLDRTGARKNLDRGDIAFLCVPVKLGAEVFGTLSVDRLFTDKTSLEEDLRLLTIIASVLARSVQLHQEALERRQLLEEENENLRRQLGERFRPSNIIGRSNAMQHVFDLVAQVAQSGATVLILGESGVGKELVAHAIHYNSVRAKGPFIRVNCAALPESIIESELFGHEKGAFTHATAQRKGRFEMADGGSIFLDEVGDLSPATQARLLRVLQEREFERVGGTQTLRVNVRVIAATNRDLEALAAQGIFREDLYYRLNVFPIPIPPLRERRTDILLLADFFVEKFSRANNKKVRRISTPAIDMLTRYHWPGNVRELENCMERAVLLTTDDVVHGHHLPPTLQTAEASFSALDDTLENKVDRYERELIVEALKSARGNMAEAARLLGLSERKMGLRVRKLSINPREYRGSAE